MESIGDCPMTLFMIITFLITNIIVILVFKAVYGKKDRYTNGMLMGVHIPADEIENEEVAKICAKSRKIWNRFHWINLVCGSLICLILLTSFDTFMLVWMIWLGEYIAILYYIVFKSHKEMYRLKISNQWIDEQTGHFKYVNAQDTAPCYVDDDEYWKNGWYNNPNDSHLLVPDRMCSVNFTFNMARPAAKIICGIMWSLTAAIIIWSAATIVQFRNANIRFKISSDEIQIEAPWYKCNFYPSDITSIKIIPNLPDDNFTRTNGSSTDKSNIGHYRGEKTGDCMMFIHKDYSPILQINLEKQILFINSKQSGEVETWYQNLINLQHLSSARSHLYET